MPTIIALTEMSSMPGRFECTHQRLPNGRVYNTTHAGRGPEAAAAYAVQIALGIGGSYAILGPRELLDCIPESIRSRGVW